MSTCIFTKTQNFHSLWGKSHIYLAVYHLNSTLGILLCIPCEIPVKELGKGMTTHILQKKPRFWCCPAYRHARRRRQNQDSAHILSGSQSKIPFPQTVCHNRMTGYYAISRLVNCCDLVLSSSRILQSQLGYCLLVLNSVEQKWPAAVTAQWPTTLGAIRGEDELLGAHHDLWCIYLLLRDPTWWNIIPRCCSI